VLVLVKPCGESAIWEAGYAAGADKPVIVLLDEKPAPGVAREQRPGWDCYGDEVTKFNKI